VSAQADNGFVIQLDALVDAITDETRVVFLNTPANPTGAIIEQTTLQELARICQQRDIWLVCDEVYSMFTFDKPHVSQ